MKTKTLFYMALTAVMTTLAACSQDDELMDAAPKATPIEFEITDGGYGGDEATRAVEEGFRTKFEDGDECGLYIIDNGEFIASNVKLTAEEGENGEITWKADGGISGVTENSKYFLYYPYYASNSLMWLGNDPSLGNVDTEVFSLLIKNFIHFTNQNTHTNYTAGDLMTATGTASTGADGKLKVSFSLTHRMALAVIEVPKTVYKFTNEGVTIPDYSVASSVDFSGSGFKPLRMDDGTYRFILNSDFSTTTIKSITGIINGKKFTISADKLKGIKKGTYKTFRIGGGATGASIEKSHELQVGDFLLKDGNLIGKDKTLTAEQKADVAAIVFWSPAETTADGRTTPASLTDDKVMAAEHPNCNHGLAVAVKKLYSDAIGWQAPAESVENFRGSDNFTHANKDKFVSIASGRGKEDNINRILGYQNTQVLLAYNKYCNNNDRISYHVSPAVLLVTFANSNPAPTGSTGWFLPSPKELHMLCYKDVDNINYAWDSSYTETSEKVETSLTAVSGENLGGGTYWSSSEDTDQSQSFYVAFANAMLGAVAKNYTFYARAVLAF